jgi:mannose-6-phosphate isomerase class I
MLQIFADMMSMNYRKTNQFLMPAVKPPGEKGGYDIYPTFRIDEGRIERGLASLADLIARHKIILIDGYAGVFFDQVRRDLEMYLKDEHKISADWLTTSDYLKPEDEIENLVNPSLGGDDPLFGKKTGLELKEFFSSTDMSAVTGSNRNKPVIIFGVGAALFSRNGLLVYLDLPKNEIQFRSRAGFVTSIGKCTPSDPKQMYKRFYFVDWVVLNKHKQDILERIDILADTQRPDDITWLKGDDFRSALTEMSMSAFRARPWFEPGTWGGNWIRDNIKGINREVQNYAWSFELISPENGIILESSGTMAEFSFDFLMYKEAERILGDCHQRFGTDFPIRFDFLDTFGGGNLSIQCHPRPDYMKECFGEDFTQEETYYILDTKENAGVYLGFNSDIDKEKFQKALVDSIMENRPVNIGDYVGMYPAKKHDLFLIPYGTIHGSGKNNLVLEISTTPYIFTFKMYDWLRPDLDGKPRPLNIQRGMDNLYFDRKGEKVINELISKPVLLKEGHGWQLFHLPTHPTHLYDVHRYHIKRSVEINTYNKCHIINLVEGERIKVKTKRGRIFTFNYAETFIIPAAAGSYSVINESEGDAVLVMAFVK